MKTRNTHKRETSVPLAGFEPTFPADLRLSGHSTPIHTEEM